MVVNLARLVLRQARITGQADLDGTKSEKRVVESAAWGLHLAHGPDPGRGRRVAIFVACCDAWLREINALKNPQSLGSKV